MLIAHNNMLLHVPDFIIKYLCIQNISHLKFEDSEIKKNIYNSGVLKGLTSQNKL